MEPDQCKKYLTSHFEQVKQTSNLCARFITHLFACPEYPPSSSNSTVKLLARSRLQVMRAVHRSPASLPAPSSSNSTVNVITHWQPFRGTIKHESFPVVRVAASIVTETCFPSPKPIHGVYDSSPNTPSPSYHHRHPQHDIGISIYPTRDRRFSLPPASDPPPSSPLILTSMALQIPTRFSKNMPQTIGTR